MKHSRNGTKVKTTRSAHPATKGVASEKAPVRIRKPMPKKQRQPVRRATMTVDEVAVYLGLSRTAAYVAVRKGEIPASRIGDRWIVPIAAVRAKFAMLDGDEGPW